jgi:glycogen operon protein
MGGLGEEGSSEDIDIHVMLNMEWEDLDFDIPPIDGRQWYRAADTALPSPNDIVGTEQAPLISGNTYRLYVTC